MVFKIYGKAFQALMKKPFRLWGISILSGILSAVFCLLFGFALGIGICISMLISVGMTMVYLHGYRGEEVHTIQIFDTCQNLETVKRTLCGMGWRYLWTLIWIFIPIVGPFFVLNRSYRYALVPYILVQEKDIKQTEAIHVSEQRMNGWKLSMFAADILVPIIVGLGYIILGRLALLPVVGPLFGLLLVLFAIAAFLCTGLFVGLVHAAYYEEISGNGDSPAYTYGGEKGPAGPVGGSFSSGPVYGGQPEKAEAPKPNLMKNAPMNNSYTEPRTEAKPVNNAFERPANMSGVQKRCPKCGMVLPENARFCGNCGNRLS